MVDLSFGRTDFDKFPFESGYLLPMGCGPFNPGTSVSSITVNAISETAVSITGSQTVTLNNVTNITTSTVLTYDATGINFENITPTAVGTDAIVKTISPPSTIFTSEANPDLPFDSVILKGEFVWVMLQHSRQNRVDL